MLAVITNALFFISKLFGIISMGSNHVCVITTHYCRLSVGKIQAVLFELEAAIQ